MVTCARLEAGNWWMKSVEWSRTRLSKC